MEFFKQILTYITAVRKHWGALVTGGSFIGLLSIWQGVGHAVPVWMYWAIGLAGVLSASFFTWRDERAKATELATRIYDGRPLFILRVFRRADSKEWGFRLENSGARPARWVQLEAVTSFRGNFSLRFFNIPVLSPGGYETIRYEVNPIGAQDQKLLSEFLDDHEPNAHLDIWDIVIKFRDANEYGGEELVRLVYKPETNGLFSAAVPYTERPAANPVLTFNMEGPDESGLRLP